MTIYDIAREAGVSITTVSRVLNNNGHVRETTRNKIMQVLSKHDYQPSAIARGLVAGSMKTVAICVVDVRIPHHAATSFLMEQQLSKLGYSVLLCNTGENIEDWRKYMRDLSERKVDGIILTASVYNRLEQDSILDVISNIPIVMVNGKLNRSNVHSVYVDEAKGIGMMTQHLYDRGKRKIALVREWQTDSGEQKKQGFLRQMRKLGYESPEKDTFECEYSLEAGAEMAERLYRMGYDAIIFGQDYTAVGAVNRLFNLGVQVPEQVAVTGHDNSFISQLCRPPLTSVDNKAGVLSDLTVKTLVDILSKDTEVADLCIYPELVIRETS